MKIVPAGTSSTEPDGNVRDGACSSKVEMVLPVGTSSVPAGTSSTKTDGNIPAGACSSEAEAILPVGTSSTKTDDVHCRLFQWVLLVPKQMKMVLLVPKQMIIFNMVPIISLQV